MNVLSFMCMMQGTFGAMQSNNTSGGLQGMRIFDFSVRGHRFSLGYEMAGSKEDAGDVVRQLNLYTRELVDTEFGSAPKRRYTYLDSVPEPKGADQVKKWIYKLAIAQVMAAGDAEREDAFSDNRATARPQQH